MNREVAARESKEVSVSEDCNFLKGRCRQLVRLLDRGTIEEDECFYNVIITLVGGPDECWSCCLDELQSRARSFRSFAKRFLETSDFMPCPRIFMAGNPSEDEVAAKQCELRPRYKNLWTLISRWGVSA